jgi:hypothetical protein
MANTLDKSGIINGQTIQPIHVTQTIDALTAADAYDITISGSLTLTGSVSSLNGFIGSLDGNSTTSVLMLPLHPKTIYLILEEHL